MILAFAPGRINDFDHMTGPKRDKEVDRTKRCVVDLLNERGRTEFPAIEVRFCNKIVPPHILDHAFTAARMARRAAGSLETFDWLASMSAALPAALEADQARIARLEPLTQLSSDGARKCDELARKGIPRELTAPLILELPAMAF